MKLKSVLMAKCHKPLSLIVHFSLRIMSAKKERVAKKVFFEPGSKLFNFVRFCYNYVLLACTIDITIHTGSK